MKKRLRFNKTIGVIACFLLVIVSMIALTPTPGGANENPPLPTYDQSAPFGIVANVANRVRRDEIGTAVGLMREAGVQWQREEIFWDRVQKRPDGPFIWDGSAEGFYDYDTAIAAQVEAGINVVGLLDYNPYWFKSKNPPPEAWMDDWGKFVYAAVARYGRERNLITHWELWNEPNVRESGYESGLYEIKHFVRMLAVGRAAAKAADPRAVIIMGGVSGIPERPEPFNYDWLEYLDLAGQEGGWDEVDILAIHFYQPMAPERPFTRYGRSANLRGELAHLDILQQRYGPKPVWMTEMGWATSSVWPGVSLDEQAFFLVRAYILALAHPSVEKVFWYDLRDDTLASAPYERPIFNRREVNFHFGLLRRTYPLDPNAPTLRKPSFLAFRAMSNILSGLEMQHIVAEGVAGRYWYRFAGGGRRVDVLWSTSGDASPLPTDCDCREALVRDWDGRLLRRILTDDGQLTLRLPARGAPLYVEYDPPPDPQAAVEGRTFEETGHTLRGEFANFWYANGGQVRFGYPLTEEMIEPEPGNGRPRIVQYFERARFVLYPEYVNTPHVVQLAHEGAHALAQQGIAWQSLPKVSQAPPSCHLFAETGHSLCPPLRAIWEQYGGMVLVGYPLTEAIEGIEPETGERFIEQYFERAQIRHYPDRPPEQPDLMFGSLTRERITSWKDMP